jgi:hypothetical protein
MDGKIVGIRRYANFVLCKLTNAATFQEMDPEKATRIRPRGRRSRSGITSQATMVQVFLFNADTALLPYLPVKSFIIVSCCKRLGVACHDIYSQYRKVTSIVPLLRALSRLRLCLAAFES